MTELCPTCGQPLEQRARYELPERELVALSAWWWTGRYSDAAMLAGVKVQTLKNQLAHARFRNQVHSTHELALLYIGQLRTKADLLAQHNARVQATKEVA